MILTRRFPQYYDVERDDYIGKRIESCYLRSPPLKPKNSFKEFKRKALLDDFEDVEGEGLSLHVFRASHRGDEIRYDKGKVVGNGKDKVDGDDSKDELISTKGDGEQNEGSSSSFNFHYYRLLEIQGCYFGDIKSYIKNKKLKKVVAIITSCKQIVLGDMNVTLKDSSGTIHYKVLSSEDGYINDIKVGSALIIHNVSVFCPKS
ncbi:phospholipase-like protein [Tanacetum coccineum]